MRRLARTLLALCLGAAWPAPAAALADGESARIVAVVDGDTVVLDTGDEVRLVGIQAPKLPLGRAEGSPWPLADEARGALAALALDRWVTLRYGGRRIDRHGRVLAHLFRDDGLWLQGELLRLGLARVYSFRDNRARVVEMLAIEDAARADGRGLWAHPFYAVRRAEPPELTGDRFELVVGRVRDVAVKRELAFLNFGADWKSDFTISIAVRDLDLFDDAGVDLAALEGRTIRVRGWVKWWNGPMIEVTHPEQIEVLAP